jgi:hypothetical protein
MHFGIEHIARIVDQPLGQGEAISQIEQIVRAGHQHRITNAIALDRDRHFLGNRASPHLGPAVGADPLERKSPRGGQTRIRTGTDFAAGTWLCSA